MKILIVGGGVAGTALAGFLKNHSDITLVDKAPAFGDIGYSLALWGNGQKILKEVGAFHDFEKYGYEIPWSAFENKKGDVLAQIFFGPSNKDRSTTSITRTNLHNALIKAMGENIKVKFGTTVDEIIEKENGAEVTFSNGEKDSFDLVVGSDGIRSRVRELVFGKNYLKYYGWSIWGFWTPKGMGSPRGVIEMVDDGKAYMMYPQGDKAVVMLSATMSPEIVDLPEKRRENLHKIFHGFNESVSNMIDAIEDPEHIFHDNLAHVDMSLWYKGRVALMGDAQHATSPLTGMGASMALEDAYVLADEIKKVNSTDELSEALSKYEKRRSKRIKEFRKLSNFIEKWLMVKSPFMSFLRDSVLRIIPASYFTNRIEKLLKEEI